MKRNGIILFSASGPDFNEIRKEAQKMARMFLDAELEEDPAQQEVLLLEAEKFSEQLEKKYMTVDDLTYNKIKEIMDEEANNISKMYFENFADEDLDED